MLHPLIKPDTSLIFYIENSDSVKHLCYFLFLFFYILLCCESIFFLLRVLRVQGHTQKKEKKMCYKRDTFRKRWMTRCKDNYLEAREVQG